MSFIDDRKEPEIVQTIDQVLESVNIKGKLTEQEGKFIEYHLIKGEPVRRALILEGYPTEPDSTMYFRGRKILRKLEENEDDHRKILRAVGAGEVAVAQGLLNLARDPKTGAVTRVAAYTTLGKMLGMSKEVIEGKHGITIIIEGPRQDRVTIPPPGGPDPAPPERQLPGQVYPPEKAITITD